MRGLRPSHRYRHGNDDDGGDVGAGGGDVGAVADGREGGVRHAAHLRHPAEAAA